MAESRTIEVAGVRIHVERFGPEQAPPVLVLHGFTGNIESMRCAIDPLAERFSVHGVDLLGHGQSSVPRDVALYRMSACIEQILGVMNALSLPRAHLLGYSMGGRVALSLCASTPARVISAVLVGASPGLRDADEAAARRASDEALAQRIEGEGLAAFVDHWMNIPLFASQKRLDPTVLERARAQRLACDPEGLAASLRGMGTGSMPALHDRLGDIEVPALLVAGELDEKFRRLGAQMAEAMPRARCVVVEDAGHAAHLERPAAFAREALRFLEGAGDPGASRC